MTSDAVAEAKKNREWRHEYMTLLMRDQKNIEKGIKQGIEQGMEQGILGAVSICRSLGLSNEEISKMLQESYGLSADEAEKYTLT